MALCRELDSLDPATVTLLTDSRKRALPTGLHGGAAGETAENYT